MLSNYTKEFRQNLKIAYPVMLGQLGHILVALADNLMVGRLGAAQLAAVSLGNSLIFIALSLGIGFSFAITPLVAEADGANDTQTGRNYFHHGIVMCALNGILLFVLLLLAKPILYYLDQPVEVVELAIPYMDIVAFSLIPLMVFQAFKQFADGLSNTRYAMYATLVSNVVNVFFNFILIHFRVSFFPFFYLPASGACWCRLWNLDLAFLYAVDAVLYSKPKKEVSTVFCVDASQSVSASYF